MLAATALALPAAAHAAERRFTVTDFDRVQVDGPWQVTLVTGRAPSAVASGNAQAIDRVSIEVQGRLLRIRPNRSAWGGYPGQGAGPVAIALTAPGLRSATVAGSGSIAIDRVRAMRFDLSLAGNGKAEISAVEADTLVLGLLGSGNIRVAGKAKTLRGTVRGTGDLDAGRLIAGDAEIDAATAGAVGVSVIRSAKVVSTGQGDVEILGTPACTVKALGSGRVQCGSD